MKWTLAIAVVLTAGFALYSRAGDPAFELRMVASDAAGGSDATISPDGQRVLTSSARAGNWDMWIHEIPTGTWSRLTDDPADDFEGRLSPDGRTAAFTSTRGGDKDIWLVDVSTRAVRRLTDSPDEEEYPTWSPDGTSILYTGGPWNARDFFIVPASGGTARKVTRSSGRVGACGFDPDGTTVVCHRYDLGSGDLVRLWLKDGEMTPLTLGDPWDYKPTASPGGRWIAFSRAIENLSQIWVMPATGGRAQQLVRSTGEDRWPTWNADGSRLLFHRLVDDGASLNLLDRRTGRVQTIDAAVAPRQASLDRTGARVAYCAQAPDGRVVKILDLRTRQVQEFDTQGLEACFPRWSPTGDRLALAVRTADRWDIAVANGDGSGFKVLTGGLNGLRGMDGVIDWSPDGHRLVFHADTEPFDARLFVLDLRTNALSPLTGSNWFDESPSWTPDGRGVVFTSTRGGNWSWGFFRVSLDDGSITRLITPDKTEKNYLRVSPAGEQLWSQVDERQVEHLVERSADGQVRPIREAGDGARWPSYSADGRSILYTTVHHRVEYWIVDHVAGRGSPLLRPPTSSINPSPAQAAFDSRREKSPNALHRR